MEKSLCDHRKVLFCPDASGTSPFRNNVSARVSIYTDGNLENKFHWSNPCVCYGISRYLAQAKLRKCFRVFRAAYAMLVVFKKIFSSYCKICLKINDLLIHFPPNELLAAYNMYLLIYSCKVNIDWWAVVIIICWQGEAKSRWRYISLVEPHQK